MLKNYLIRVFYLKKNMPQKTNIRGFNGYLENGEYKPSPLVVLILGVLGSSKIFKNSR